MYNTLSCKAANCRSDRRLTVFQCRNYTILIYCRYIFIRTCPCNFLIICRIFWIIDYIQISCITFLDRCFLCIQCNTCQRCVNFNCYRVIELFAGCCDRSFSNAYRFNITFLINFNNAVVSAAPCNCLTCQSRFRCSCNCQRVRSSPSHCEVVLIDCKTFEFDDYWNVTTFDYIAFWIYSLAFITNRIIHHFMISIWSNCSSFITKRYIA